MARDWTLEHEGASVTFRTNSTFNFKDWEILKNCKEAHDMIGYTLKGSFLLCMNM